ncbi:SLC25A39_40 [Mytilus edulis]|uniref:SLC25A39_40 n=1 Tax=Mytilus edulis TaxID=6550 RepID=A0A8S3RIJ5_MYTED|nr:SLC25A39_40 [Mytilus edulis]
MNKNTDAVETNDGMTGNGITPVQQMISSCSGAFVTSVFVTPLDVIKIRLQSQKKPLVKGQIFQYCNGLMDHVCVCAVNGGSSLTPAPECPWYKRPIPKPLTGTADAFFKILKYEGVASLWSGLPPTLVMAIPATVIYFSCYEICRKKLGYHGGLEGSDWWKPMIAGAAARTMCVTVISPIEMIRTKLQSEQLSYSQIRKSLGQSIKTGGVTMLWKGLGPTLLRDVPFSEEETRTTAKRGPSLLTIALSVMAGDCFGEQIAGILTLPFDVIKTHRQIELGEVLKENKNATRSTWKLMMKMQADHGYHALFTGLLPRTMKVAPACAIMISSYEYFKAYFREQNRLNPS